MIDAFSAYLQGQAGYFPPAGVPPRLYKYVPAHRAINVLLTNTVYFARRRQLNDPFDGKVVMDFDTPQKIAKLIAWANMKLPRYERLGVSTEGLLGSAEQRKRYQKKLLENPKFAENMNREFTDAFDRLNIGIFCMTSKNDSFPMWAHYAAQHAGCCLEFDLRELNFDYKWDACLPFVSVARVGYSNKHPTFPDAADTPPHERGSIYMTKSPEWKYESEWRSIMYDGRKQSLITQTSLQSDEVIAASGMADAMRGARAYSLNEGLISGVILGHKITQSDKDAVVAAANYRKIEVYQASPELYEYGMKIKSL